MALTKGVTKEKLLFFSAPVGGEKNEVSLFPFCLHPYNLLSCRDFCPAAKNLFFMEKCWHSCKPYKMPRSGEGASGFLFLDNISLKLGILVKSKRCSQ